MCCHIAHVKSNKTTKSKKNYKNQLYEKDDTLKSIEFMVRLDKTVMLFVSR